MATQHAGIDGQNNIIVQIEGDNNAVNLQGLARLLKGLARLPLIRYLTRRRIDNDIDILSPYSRSIPLIGREAELPDLTPGRPVSIRMLTGRGGRLARTRGNIAACATMRP